MNSTQVNCFLESAKLKSFSKAAAKQHKYYNNIPEMRKHISQNTYRRSYENVGRDPG